MFPRWHPHQNRRSRPPDYIDALPDSLASDRSIVQFQFRRIAAERGISEALINSMIDELPPQLRMAPCFFDRITSSWRYTFGDPLELKTCVVLGPPMVLPVQQLLTAVDLSWHRLPEKKRRDFIRRLGDEKKHRDAIGEMEAIANVPQELGLEHEVAGSDLETPQ